MRIGEVRGMVTPPPSPLITLLSSAHPTSASDGKSRALEGRREERIGNTR